MDKHDILNAIRHSAAANGGIAPGRQRFANETGIRESDWSGKFWARWSDAVTEAGVGLNKLQSGYTDEEVLAPLAVVVSELGRFPVSAELRMRRRTDPSFPSHNTFTKFGGRAELARRLALYCAGRDGLDDVIRICEPLAQSTEPSGVETSGATGFVYLVKSGRHHKIGHTAALGRRTYELAIQLPERLQLVHAIETDDPAGIERYWHQRFADRRANGEWFQLTAADIAAFRRRKQFM